MKYFNKFYYEHDLNNDGVISKNEMAKFLKNFTTDPLDDFITQKVNEIWFKYDIDRSGYLDKVETATFLKELLTDNGQSHATALSFNKWFNEYDINGDGLISKSEMAIFVRKFFKDEQPYNVKEFIEELFDSHDSNRNGVLEKREFLRMLNDILNREGKSPISLPYFNKLY